MPAGNKNDSTISHIDDLLGKPPLIRGEDAARYWRVNAAIAHESKPETIFDKIRVREITNKYWEQQRCKQALHRLSRVPTSRHWQVCFVLSMPRLY